MVHSDNATQPQARTVWAMSMMMAVISSCRSERPPRCLPGLRGTASHHCGRRINDDCGDPGCKGV